MLTDIAPAADAEAWVRRELAAGRRIMGFGTAPTPDVALARAALDAA